MQLFGEVVFHKKFGEGKILDKIDRIINDCSITKNELKSLENTELSRQK